MIVTEIVAVLALGLLVAGVVKVALTVWPPPGAKLPDPAMLPDMPNAGPASPQSAHEAMSRQRSAARPKFRD